jgi:periplasmic protein TonB
MAVHLGAIALLLVARSPRPEAMAPTYRVNLVAAPPGPRAIGVVNPPAATPPPTPAAQTPPPRRAETRPNDMPAPKQPTARRPPPVAATPNVNAAPARPNTPATPAGGGPTGGRGTDVADVNTGGIEFPFPSYLQNIVRQIALNFKPRNPNAPLRAEVFFIIQRDGSVTGLRLVTRSSSYAFDVEALGAVEAAASARGFGPLPEGFSEPSLPVTFSFDPKRLR